VRQDSIARLIEAVSCWAAHQGRAWYIPDPLSAATDNDAGVSETHDTNTDSDPGTGADIVVQLMPFADTPNPGGV